MSIFTGSELEFLAGLNKSWWRLYWKEFSRLRRIEAAAPGSPPEGNAAVPIKPGAREDPICAFRQRSAATAAASRRVAAR